MKTEDVMKRLRAANPVDASDLKNWPTSDRGRDVLQRAASTPLHRTQRRARHRRFPRLVLPAFGAIAAIVIAVQVIPVPGIRNGSTATAAEVLYATALIAETLPETPVPAHGYSYTKSEGAYLSSFGVGDQQPEVTVNVGHDPSINPRKGGSLGATKFAVEPGTTEESFSVFSVLVPHVREIWIGADGSGRLVRQIGEPEFLGPRDEARWEAAGRPALDRPRGSDETFKAGELYYQDFSKYSTDPDELYEQIREEAEGNGDFPESGMFGLVGDLLRETAAPPDLRAALYRVAARIPGVELVGEVIDPAGRRGIAVALTTDDAGSMVRNELIFDPDTSELLAERDVLLERVDWVDAEPSTVIGFAVYLDSGTVGSTSEHP